jgi:hypothetical protein
MQVHAGWQWCQPAISDRRKKVMKAYELLSDASKWTKYALARINNGRECDPRDDCASRFSVDGAIFRCYRRMDEHNFHIQILNNALIKRGQFKGVSRWNDASATTFQDIQSLLTELDI